METQAPTTEPTETTPEAGAQLTEAQAVNVVVQGVNREIRQDTDRTMAYVKDATKLRGFKVRELAYKADGAGKLQGKPDSYCSNISNANGVIALFEYDVEAFKTWLDTSPTKSLTAIFKAFRELFVEKPEPAPVPEGDESGDAGESSEPTPLIDVVMSALPHLTPEERVRVIEACWAIDQVADEPEADEAEAA